MEVTKTGVFSVVGRPNVGKSTLMNALCGTKIAIVSDKPQTTRTRITGVLTKDEYQMVFLDTPGLHKPKNRLGDFMVKVVNETVADVDTVMLLVEPVARIGIPEQMLIDKIKQFDMPAILVINKIDTVEKETLLEVMAMYSEACDFLAVIPLSAKTGDGVALLESVLREQCFESPALFPEDMVSDQPERQIVAEIVREKLLTLLDKEIPHGTAVEIEKFSEREDSDVLDIGAVIYCERKSHKGIIIGKNGAMLKKVGAMARTDIEELLGCRVYLQLWVKVKEGWRDSVGLIRNFGYDERM
ncbi:MAG: GTPase Era [Clostridia bacterium]|nr:GTPase Era [Clostridia bacterium]